MKALNVTTKELTAVLLNTPNSIGSFVQILQFTEPKCLVKDRVTKEPFTSTIKKLTSLTVLLNTEYEKGVLNALKKENKDSSEYEKGINTMPIDFQNSLNEFCGFFKNEAVIQYRPFENSNAKVKYFLESKLIEKSKLPNVLPTENKATNQGTEKEIFWRKLYVANIRKIKINGIIYKNVECI